VTNRTLLIDADIVAYKFASATEQVFYFNGKGEEPSVAHDLDAAVKGAGEYIEELANRLKATDLIICLTDRGNEFRKDFYPAYKGNRKGRKPADLYNLIDHFRTTYKTYLRPRLEADDCMGILSTHPSLVKGERIIVSEDKDMQTIPGLLFNPAKDKAPRKISKLQADRFHLWQTVVGDPVDGYPGARGVGPKSPEAQAILAAGSVGEMWKHVVAAFERVRGRAVRDWQDDRDTPPASQLALVQARCARILRASDWDFQRKEPRLWRPPA
jgi:DNA polymerase-1